MSDAPASRFTPDPEPWRMAPHVAARGADAETVDLGAVARTVGRGWRTAVAGALLGLVGGVALVLFFPARWPGTATVLVRNANDPTSSLLTRFGIGGEIGGGGGALGSMLKSPLETELQLLGSRDVLGQVVDSVGLHVRVLSPRGVPSRSLVVPGHLARAFKRRTYAFERQGDGSYRVDGPEARGLVARPGAAVALPEVGAITLAAGPLPPSFRLKLEDHEDAVTRLESRLGVEKKGGEVVELDYAGPDSLTAAEVPNEAVAVYLERRRTVDRGLNQRRYEFLTRQADSVSRELATAEGALRAEQEASGVLDPELSGKAGIDALQQVRKELVPIEAERQAAHRIIEQVQVGALTARQLAAFPSLLKSPAINTVLSQIATLETQRTTLLERRTERDPEVVALTTGIRDLERDLVQLGTAYTQSLDRQAESLTGAQHVIEARMGALPGQAEGNLRRQRDVKRLSQTELGLQAQIIDARLAAIGEGGQVRAVDVARPAKRPTFPRPIPTTLVAGLLGLLGGMAWAVMRASVSTRLRTVADVERASGLPAAVDRAGRALLLGADLSEGTIVVAPVDTAAAAAAAVVARRVAEQGNDRGRRVVVVDLADAAPGTAGRAVAAAETAHDLTVVPTPPLDDRRTAAVLAPSRLVLLVARTGVSRAGALAEAADVVVRLGIRCAGVVLVEGDGDGRVRSHGSWRGADASPGHDADGSRTDTPSAHGAAHSAGSNGADGVPALGRR